jgi:predicted house-cleaning NTP pyrophosphatase (Maf/HAM1 superfamily)
MDGLAKDFGFSYRQMQADIDEQALGDRSSCPESLVTLLAQSKADALKTRLLGSSGILITCDQVVVCNGRILEKPEGPEEVSHP